MIKPFKTVFQGLEDTQRALLFDSLVRYVEDIGEIIKLIGIGERHYIRSIFIIYDKLTLIKGITHNELKSLYQHIFL